MFFFFILFACLFSFTKLLPQRQSPVVGQNLGELSAAAWRLWQGHLGINVLPVGYSHLSAVPSLLPLQFRWSWLSGCGQPRGDARTHTLGHTRTHARAHTHARTHTPTHAHTCARTLSHLYTHSESDGENTAPFEDLWEGLPLTSITCRAGPFSSSLALVRTRSAQVYPTSPASGSLPLPESGAASG